MNRLSLFPVIAFGVLVGCTPPPETVVDEELGNTSIVMDSLSGPRRVMVEFRSTPDVAMLRSAGAQVIHQFPEANAVAVLMDGRAYAQVSNNPNVVLIEEDPDRQAMGLSAAQVSPALSNGLYGLVAVKAVDVHARGVTGSGFKLCLADTGIDYTHPDIAPNYRGGIDTVGTGDSDPWWNGAAEETHATHVAGTILGANNSAGVLGVAYGADLYAARVLGATGGTSSDVMEGVRALVEQFGCRVVNLSLGGSRGSHTEKVFYESIRSAGVLVVAASGNDGSTRTLSYPAKYTVNIAVGAVDVNNVRASFSNAGKELDVVAPGVSVLSSVPANQGSEAEVTSSAGSTPAFPMTYAARTTGTSGTLVNCGQGQVGEFPASVSGNVALIQRGTIAFADKVLNAMNAGAAAVVVYNNAAGDFFGTLNTETTADGRAWIPAVSVSDTAGAALVSRAGSSHTVVNKLSSWDYYSGTSMATPHVTGVVGLIWAADPSQTNDQVEAKLFSTARDLGAAGFDTLYGRGLVDASAAVAAAGR